MVAEALLALVIMGTRLPLYAPYVALARRPEGLSAIADQQFGGALMLEPASLPLLVALVWAIKRWLAQTERPSSRASTRICANDGTKRATR